MEGVQGGGGHRPLVPFVSGARGATISFRQRTLDKGKHNCFCFHLLYLPTQYEYREFPRYLNELFKKKMFSKIAFRFCHFVVTPV